MESFKLLKEKLDSNFTPLQCYETLKKSYGINDCYIMESLSGLECGEIMSVVGFDKLAQISIKVNELTISGIRQVKEVLKEFLSNCSYLKSNKESFFIDEKRTWDVLQGIYKVFSVKEHTNFGFLTFLGYDAAWHIEKLPRIIQKDDLELPEICLVLYRGIITFNQANSNAVFEQIIMNDFSPIDINILEKEFKNEIEPKAQEKISLPTNISDSITKEEFISIAESCLEHITNGDIYQIQIGHELQITSKIDPFDVYLRLRKINPSPYMYFIPINDAIVVGASPELFVRKQGEKVAMRPIAGTVRRGENANEDKRNIYELLSSEKEVAEHMMLVDLCRNDLGRLCKPGTLDVNEQLEIERYSHIFHLVSNVRVELDDGKDIFDVLASTFPAGTMTGTPKIRAMEIIESYEKSRRGMYAGALGLISLNGDAVMSLCIRTALYKDSKYSIRASAGIVADSKPENEWQETLNKLNASYLAITGKEFEKEIERVKFDENFSYRCV